MTTENTYEDMKEEARLLLSEVKRFQLVSEKNPICREAAELLNSIRNRLNVMEHFTDESGRIMREAAENHHSSLQERPRKTFKPARRVSLGERAKRQAVKRGAILVRGV